MSLKQIKKFEKCNKNVSVNVYGLNEKNNVYPLRISEYVKLEHFDLLLISNSQGIHHYCYINNFSRLLSSQVSKFNHKADFCKRCLSHFYGKKREQNLKIHERSCSLNKPVKVVMPQNKNDLSNKILKFTNYQNKLRLPLVLYSDFECILNKVSIK